VVTEPPIDHVSLSATSLADDLGFVALADLSSVLTDVSTEYRIIGGHMMTALVARWGLGSDLYRETGDTDLGAPPLLLRTLDLSQRLTDLGYEQVAGDRFSRPITDIPARLVGHASDERYATIDVLLPAYTSRARTNRKVGVSLFLTEAHGLADSLLRPPVQMQLSMQRLGGDVLTATLSFPDEVSALVLKTAASQARSKDTDIVDLWRCLEICFAANIRSDDFQSEEAIETLATVRKLFLKRDGPGMMTLIGAQGLSQEGADGRYTRIQALIGRTIDAG
jgi:hypothetical protein